MLRKTLLILTPRICRKGPIGNFLETTLEQIEDHIGTTYGGDPLGDYLVVITITFMVT